MAELPNPFSHSGVDSVLAVDEAAVPIVAPAGAAAALSDIGQIFVGARKLEQSPGIFDPAAYTSADELAYVEMKLADDPRAADLPAVPDEDRFMEAIEPMPLFLRQAAGF